MNRTLLILKNSRNNKKIVKQMKKIKENTSNKWKYFGKRFYGLKSVKLGYSTVTHLAKFLGLSGSNSLKTDT